ncbi:membrane dipeptidase [Pontibacter sp. G13]|uniref:dipeptidase n=1 Tax=Pontibacter sp. G13 TaxID=3074898 RepID=UPI00288C25E1|nr:membrane dipeptidase [Pontibacter sp. G13]WNJ21299.1 membrane dipeptidase [Pontibacter sp. G13]
MNKLPIIDLHCDLLSYLVNTPNGTPNDVDSIGAAIPHLKAGNVKAQTLAIFAATKDGSRAFGQAQFERFQQLLDEQVFVDLAQVSDWDELAASDQIGARFAIESGSAICEEEGPLEQAFNRLVEWEQSGHKPLYISFTHHPENRFGGGNYSDNVGLKSDGKALLEYLDGRGICVDLSHASDALAEGIFAHKAQQSLDVPIIASHSNFRHISGHVRNLPNELAQEIIHQGGLIGMNGLRDYIHPSDPMVWLEHFQYAMDLGAEKSIAWGVDFFGTDFIADPARFPLFLPEMENASCYPFWNQAWLDRGISEDQLTDMAWRNAWNFMDSLAR